MRHRPSADDDDLARRIAGAFERLPLPESARLDAIEDRLARALPSRQQTRRAPVWYWWLLGALAVGGAAAWWGGQYWLIDDEPVSSPGSIAPFPPPASRAPTTAGTEAPVDHEREGEPERQQKDVYIYRHERR